MSSPRPSHASRATPRRGWRTRPLGDSRSGAVLRAALVFALLALAAVPLWHAWHVPPASTTVFLVQPTTPGDEARTVIQAWQAALAEEGFQASALNVERIGRDGLPGHPRALLLPDTALVAMSDSAVAAVTRYVREGGRVLLCFDAGTQRSEDGSYSALRSRLSVLAGVSYAQYAQRGTGMFKLDTVQLNDAGVRALAVQPGKALAGAHGLELKAYGYSQLRYPHLVTEGSPGGEVLARSPTGDVLIVRRRVGQGEVLFVNLPLGYLKTRSDGYLLHQTLRLFLADMVGAPQLLAVPGGVGGMVLNVHVDSGAAVAPLQVIEQRGLLKGGPFSLHFTAGPDTYRTGDGAGLNVDGSPWAQAFIRRMAALGHEVGNHGGWIHNEFGEYANEGNRDRFEPLLQRNHASMTRALGRAPTTYSAPSGNQPLWSSRWLAANGITAHYDTGGSGLGPTRAWRDGHRVQADLWAFPVASFGGIATFEEIPYEADPHPPDPPARAREIASYRQGMLALIDHAATQRIARLSYMHAPAAARHVEIVGEWIERAAQHAAAGRFRWYRMEELAQFMTRREQARWDWDGRTLRASHPQSLVGLTWRLQDLRAEQVRIENGAARLHHDGTQLLVEALAGSQLQLSLR